MLVGLLLPLTLWAAEVKIPLKLELSDVRFDTAAAKCYTPAGLLDFNTRLQKSLVDVLDSGGYQVEKVLGHYCSAYQCPEYPRAPKRMWLALNTRVSYSDGDLVMILELWGPEGMLASRAARQSKGKVTQAILLDTAQSIAHKVGILASDTLHSIYKQMTKIVDLGMANIPEGCSFIGKWDGERYEKPVHYVCFSAFRIDRTEATINAFQSQGFKLSNLAEAKCGINCPVTGVTWNEADQYCHKVGKRLPTEAEWEYAAYAGNRHPKYSSLLTAVVERTSWTSDNSLGNLHLVALKAANGWDLFDMRGNADEWVQDWFDSTYYVNSPSQNPPGPATGTRKVFRGGNYWITNDSLDYGRRRYSLPNTSSTFRGFRCATN